MDNHKKLFEGLLKADGINPAETTESEHTTFAKMLDRQLKSKPSKPGVLVFRPDIWRIIMKSKITKFAAAAVVILVAMVGITILDKTVTPAWAIEDTIKALENVRAIKLIGKMTQWTGGVAEVTIWATPDANGSQSEYARMDGPGQILVSTPKTTYRYWSGINKVRIEKAGGLKISPWLGKEFFENLKSKAADWRQNVCTDANSGITYVVVDCNSLDDNSSWRFVFDTKTKLPVSFTQTSNIKESDVMKMQFSQIEYNPQLPKGIFDFVIPEGATVVTEDSNQDMTDKISRYINDPNRGMDITGISREDACKKIVSEYIQAVIAGDWTTVDTLRSSGGRARQWKNLYTQKTPIKAIIEIHEPRREANTNIGIIAPVTVKLADGTEKTISYVVAFRDRGQQQWCVIIGTWGSVAEF